MEDSNNDIKFIELNHHDLSSIVYMYAVIIIHGKDLKLKTNKAISSCKNLSSHQQNTQV